MFTSEHLKEGKENEQQTSTYTSIVAGYTQIFTNNLLRCSIRD